MLSSPLLPLSQKKAKKSSTLLHCGYKFSFKNFMSFMIMQTQADREWQDKELGMSSLELNAQHEENMVHGHMM